ncbi:MAG: tRNA pseudouridine(38-40) synthase TruA [Actinomycetota bacterium]
MRNIRLTVSYLGRGFKGWQRQKSGLTVQGELENALAKIIGEPVAVNGAGRTDAGVNAREQVANFLTSSSIPPDRLVRGLNAVLPDDIVVTGAADVDLAWRARKSARWREYEYLIWNRPFPDLFLKDIAVHVAKPLDVAAMKRSLDAVKGRHDWRAFCVASSAPKGCERIVKEVELDEPQIGLVRLTVRADGFVHKMVRSLAGTVIEVGLGRQDEGIIREMLRSGDRKLAGRTAPARGLTLTRIGY